MCTPNSYNARLYATLKWSGNVAARTCDTALERPAISFEKFRFDVGALDDRRIGRARTSKDQFQVVG